LKITAPVQKPQALSETHSPLKKGIISLCLGLAGFAGSFYSLNFASENFSISIIWSLCFPLISSMAYGARYAFISGILGAGALFPFFIWKNNGWATIVAFPVYLLFFVWHGYFSEKRAINKTIYNDPLIVQLPYTLIYAAALYFLYPPAFFHNPPSWAPDALTSIPDNILNGIILKSSVIMYIVTLFTSFLLITPEAGKVLGLLRPGKSRNNGKILAAALAGSFFIWLLLLCFNSIFVENDFPAKTFSVSSPFEIMSFIVILFTGLAAGYIICFFLEKRYIAEAELKASLMEKEILLRELYHRTKNNMQVISSMIGMRAAESGNETVKAIFKDTNAKIKTMSLVHEKLYQAGDLSCINLKEYIGEVICLFVKIHELKDSNISVTENIDNISALIDTAIPCGLIIGELITNSFKHAFAEGGAGKITVSLSQNLNGVIELVFSDNGSGLPAGADPATFAKLGLRSVITLAEHQLQGSIEFKSGAGFSCVIKFTDNLYEPRV